MNANEIVKTLRAIAKRCDGTHSCWYSGTLKNAADCIESLQAQLAESQRREKAAVEVVRCGKCRHYNTTGCSDGCGWCENMDRGVFDEHYCSRGERREKE
jgi:hypothetical protein